ncbi:hypothetical protein CMQ_6974 [Grosmannia clavigera kw1407]|uniref:Uncharacterized protein n=1 Tax=Grosmannia clavigera (strain kw1407 / UAMH 11150) TaxID=655863 RepID=F0X7U9_GROCL|nr:uncharacterized protein CMQ_6974 [Grosmannia clavigera kw1407]EFX06653.1 hypothetical protein CMQ_6974 [Grosmannia clavigera kw1407]
MASAVLRLTALKARGPFGQQQKRGKATRKKRTQASVAVAAKAIDSTLHKQQSAREKALYSWTDLLLRRKLLVVFLTLATALMIAFIDQNGISVSLLPSPATSTHRTQFLRNFFELQVVLLASLLQPLCCRPAYGRNLPTDYAYLASSAFYFPLNFADVTDRKDVLEAYMAASRIDFILLYR